MVPDLIDSSKIFNYLTDNGEFKELKGTIYLKSPNELTYCDIELDDTPYEFTFNLKRRQWYCVQKALGLVKPIYKKKRKGKRYVWREII